MPEPVTGPVEPLQQTPPSTGAYRSLASTGAETPATAVPSAATSANRGRFTILRPHAQGGLGQVSVARDEKLKRQVALKEIRPDRLGSETLRQRFVTEAEITGILEHPGIVPVYALDEDESGQPYYAMRFIEGKTLAEAIHEFHVDRERGDVSPPVAGVTGELTLRRSRNDFSSLPFRALLQRFISVCQTIAYAHSKGVLHRDLKPANIMLGDYGETLVLDWGLAKRVGELERESVRAPEERAPTLPLSHALTQEGQVLGTAPYMSPEQAAGNIDQLGPPTDIYALGAILYELLTGRPPYAGGSVKDILNQVQAGPPPGPSQRHRAVPKPLEAICRKAMARTASERYPTAADLAKEVDRYLADEPVTAYREPGLVIVGRWMRRHRPLVAGAAALLLAAVPLSIALAVISDQARQQAEGDKVEIANQKEKAEANEKSATENEAITRAALEFVETKVFAAARPKNQEGGMGYDVKLADAVKASLPFVATSFKDQPLIEARLRTTLGISFSYLGEPKIAAEQAEIARRIYTKQLGHDHGSTLKSMNNLANIYDDLGQHADALKLYEETLALSRAKVGPDHPDTLGIMNNLSCGYEALGRHAEALKFREETLALRKAKLGPDHSDTLSSMNNLALSYYALGRHADALKLFEETVALRKATLGPDHPDTLSSKHNMAVNYAALGRHGEALNLDAETLALRKATLGLDHPDTLKSMANLAKWFDAIGRPAEALKLREEMLALHKAKLGPDHPDTLDCMWRVGVGYSGLGRHANAVQLFKEMLTHQKAKLGPDHPDTLVCMSNLGSSYYKLGRHADALKQFEETLALKKAKFGPDHPDTLMSMWAVAESLARLDRGSEIVPIIDECLKLAAGKIVHKQLISGVIGLRLRHFAKTKDAAGCRSTAEMWEKLNRTDADSLYNAACMRAVAAAVIKHDAKTPGADATRLAKEEADRAMAWLKQAVAKGYMNAGHMKQDTDLDTLREREDFKKLLGETEAKVKEKDTKPPPAEK